jgi:hypothetical protein
LSMSLALSPLAIVKKALDSAQPRRLENADQGILVFHRR